MLSFLEEDTGTPAGEGEWACGEAAGVGGDPNLQMSPVPATAGGHVS